METLKRTEVPMQGYKAQVKAQVIEQLFADVNLDALLGTIVALRDLEPFLSALPNLRDLEPILWRIKIAQAQVGDTQECIKFNFDMPMAKKLGLTNTELTVLGGLLEGKGTQAIADSMCRVKGTIEGHLTRIYLKLEVTSRFEAVEKAKKLGLFVGL